ncbi:hypothetical protein P171DRAFT_436792, partial [Karstenula rhodostoma CBS 690.94]
MRQSTSPLLTLPRELRDQVYRYVLQETNGYALNATSGQLRTFEDTPIDLSLSYTCKQIYSEMRGMAFKVNRIMFTSQLDRSSTRQASSNTRRFYYLMNRYYFALTAMLSWASSCVTSDHLDVLFTLHPYNNDVRMLQQMSDDDRLHQLRTHGLVHNGSGRERSIGTIMPLYDLLKLISKDARFYALTAKEYDSTSRNGEIPPYQLFYYQEDGYESRYDDSKHVPFYAPNTEQKILERPLQPWWIPDINELEMLENFLPEIYSDSDSGSDSDLDDLYPGREQRWYFSATAVAVRFLERLSEEHRTCIRQVSIIENHQCSTNHPSHPHGLIPFWIENPQLQVEFEIDVWNVLFWPVFHESSRSILSTGFLKKTTQFLREALLLPSMGMPTGQFTLRLRGKTPEAEHIIWDNIKKAAEVQAAAEQLHQSTPQQQKHMLIRQHIAEDFPQIIRKVLEGNTLVLFENNSGTSWDLDQATYDLENTLTYSYGWHKVTNFAEFERQAEVWEKVREEYHAPL